MSRLGLAAGTLAFIIATVVYLVLAATALNIGENQRYRFMTEPFLFILGAAARLPRPRAARDARTGRVSSASDPASIFSVPQWFPAPEPIRAVHGSALIFTAVPVQKPVQTSPQPATCPPT